MSDGSATQAAAFRVEVPLEILPTPEALGEALARDILAGIVAAGRDGRRYLLGCPAGRSGRVVYRALGGQALRAQADLSSLVIVMMDEYVVPVAGGHELCREDAHYSCRRFASEEIAAVVGAGLPPGRRIPPEQVWFPRPSRPAEYDERLAAAGGVDLFLVASGASDGHVAFNPPGSPLESGTRIVALAESTRRDNLATFPAFRSLDEVPRHGVSVGLGTIARSRQVAMILHGQHKRTAARRLLDSGDFTPDWPASFVYRCSGGRILLDAAAAGSMVSRG